LPTTLSTLPPSEAAISATACEVASPAVAQFFSCAAVMDFLPFASFIAIFSLPLRLAMEASEKA
jgi:uncharacterized membrane protein